ncbi:MAG: spermidine synthase [Betaproteobacteria bacterium]
MSLENKKRVLFFIFVLSGIGGLIYESIWSHYLKLFLGHAAYAQSLVLAIFMGGMGIGAWLAGRFSTRIKNLLLGYAAVELIIGMSALIFHRVFVAFVNASYETILPALSSPALAELFRWCGSALMILPQSILLGMTFPLLSGGLIRLFPATPGPVLSMLYFTNSLGAAIGVLFSGFVLIAAVGLPGTILTAGIINILVALSVWALSKGLPAGEVLPAQPAIAASTGSHLQSRPLLIVALLTGCASFIYEVIWIRMLSMVLGSSNHAFEVMLCAFILGLAFGSLFIKRYIHRLANPRFTLAIIQVVMGFLAVGSLLLYNTSFDAMQMVMLSLAKTEQGYVAFNLASLLITIAIMFPAAFCAGMTLPLITHLMIREGQGEASIGNVYAANTIGSIMGVVIAVHAGLPLLGIKGSLMLGAAVDIAAGIYLLGRIGTSHPRRFSPTLVTVVSLLSFALVFAFVRLDTLKMASGIYRFGTFASPENTHVVMHKDGKTATVDLLSEFGVLTLKTNGKTDAAVRVGEGPPTADEYTQILLGAFSLFHKPQAEYVAVVGMGSGMTTHAVLSSPNVREVHTIEIEPFIVDGARQMGPSVARAFNDPRSRIFIDDAKSFLAVTPRQYDMIISEPSNPWVSGVSSLFTREFYGRMKSKLKPDGVFVQWLQIYQLDYDLVATVVNALDAEFGDYVIYQTNGGDLAIIASPGKLTAPVNDLFSFPNAITMLKPFNVAIRGDLEMRRVGDKAMLQPYFRSQSKAQNSDFFPVLDLNATRHRYLGKNANQLGELTSYSIPVTDLLQGVSPSPATPLFSASGPLTQRLSDTVVARQMMEYTSDGDLLNKPALAGMFGLEMEHVRNYWLSCNAGNVSKARLQPMLRLAQFVNPAFSKPELAPFWNRFLQSPCFSMQPAANQHWLQLFAAVGMRDARAIVDVARKIPPGTAILEAAGSSDFMPDREYRQVALLAARIALGNKEEARKVWAEIVNAKSEQFRSTQLARLLAAQLAP